MSAPLISPRETTKEEHRESPRTSRPGAARRVLSLAALTTLAALVAGCSASSGPAENGDNTPAPQATSVSITDNHGTMDVPTNPERFVALDNTVFGTLAAWDLTPVAVPKPVMGKLWPEFTSPASILDVGSHREPNLEAVVEADAELIIGGYRFASVYSDLTAITPTTIEISPRDGEDHTSELKREVTILGKIFQREKEATEIAAKLDKAISDAKGAYNGTDSVMGLITSGGKIAYAAPSEGRGVGTLFPTLGLKPAIDREAEDTSHGDEISVEAIAQANPEWLIVLDRDGAFQEDGYVPAADLISKSEALANVPAVKKSQIIVLDPNFYLDEGIQAYTTLYQTVADRFAAAQ